MDEAHWLSNSDAQSHTSSLSAAIDRGEIGCNSVRLSTATACGGIESDLLHLSD